ncbi:hypothetical protein KAZ57_02070 [Patescibacteria group bacterium]|nr:hypothetical protein [Patescibacteria group bacterium]
MKLTQTLAIGVILAFLLVLLAAKQQSVLAYQSDALWPCGEAVVPFVNK